LRSFYVTLLLGAVALAAAPSLLAPPSASARARPPVDFERKAARAYERDLGVSSVRIPKWLDNDPTVIATVGASVLEADTTHPMTIKDGVATASLPQHKLTWMARVVAIPPQSKACATVYVKFYEDFKPGDGGKLPGFSDTGMGRQAHGAPEIINGKPYPNAGWGGRHSDGVHWSARTGFGGWTESRVSMHTYYYANTDSKYGRIHGLGSVKKGAWTAYVECVNLNTPGEDDGGLFYETVDDGPIYSNNDISWRKLDVPESMIRELWIDIYCGGTNCGPNPAGTVSFGGAVVTKGLPDMKAIKAEVARLNTLKIDPPRRVADPRQRVDDTPEVPEDPPEPAQDP
jgi:hypothetical protein